MSEPLNLAEDLRVTRGILRSVSVKVYDPATDAHGDPMECRGFRGEKRVATVGVGDSGQTVLTQADWTLTDLATRPVQHSIVVDPETADEWVIDLVKEHEPNTGLWDCETHLLPTDAG